MDLKGFIWKGGHDRLDQKLAMHFIKKDRLIANIVPAKAQCQAAIFPIHNICAVKIEEEFDFKLKPIKKSVVGECSCTEDPTTNLAQSMIGEETGIQAYSFCEVGTIIDVGEGIVILSFDEEGATFTAAISSCKISALGADCL
ncbi:hypothetical protein [Chengkuizengella sediminis]|uniref:hypothetical protein n=1 Tax=Chengkuizengella sediminis TaxID=1885917 RepID=UPI00138A19E1|nr:hypothetical protein [Chengkuizengella sediminis]NDI33440.1 hypothetical protein [Chengkuizengella sediminis]